MKKVESRELLLSVFGVALVIIAIVGVTYAMFTYTSSGKQENVIKTGAITMSYVESDKNVISIDNALPTPDEVGIIQKEYFDFTLSSSISGVATVSYEIWAKSISVENALEENKIRVYLEAEDSSEYISILEPTTFDENSEEKGMLLYSDTFVNSSNDTKKFVKNYRFRMWVDENAPIEESSKSFKIKINVYANA